MWTVQSFWLFWVIFGSWFTFPLVKPYLVTVSCRGQTSVRTECGMDKLRKVGVLGGLLGCKLWCYGYLWLLCPANQGHYGTLIRNTIFFTTRRLGLPSCWGSWNLPCRSSWIPPWTSAAKEAPRWRACARGELLLDLHDMSTVSVIRCHRRSAILCNCSLVLHGFAWFWLVDIGWYWLVERCFSGIWHLDIFTLTSHISHSCQGDGTGFGQSSDVMLIGPDRLNGVVNGYDPLQWLARWDMWDKLWDYVGLFKRWGAFCIFLWPWNALNTRLPTGICKSLDLLFKGTPKLRSAKQALLFNPFLTLPRFGFIPFCSDCQRLPTESSQSSLFPLCPN